MRAPSKWAILSAFAALYLIWGSTYLFIRFAISSLPPFFMAGTRFLTAGFVIYVIARCTGVPRPRGITWRDAAIIGGCLILGGNGGVTLSEKFIGSGLAAVIVATVPIYIVLLTWATGSRARPSPLVFAGLFGGLIGVAILVAPAFHSIARHDTLIGISILLFSSLLWSIGSVYSRHAQLSESTFLAAGQQMLCGGFLQLLTSLILREKFQPETVTALSLWSWIYLVFIGAILGYGAYAFLLRHCDAGKVSTYAYVNPIVAVLLGFFFAGETLSPRTFVAAALIIGSVAIVITAQSLHAHFQSLPNRGVAEAE